MNKVIMLGRLTKDPELRYSPSKVAVTRFTIAVDRRYQKQGEERQTDFFNCVSFRSTAEFIERYFVKGQKIALCGSLQSRKYDDDGKTRIAVDICVDEVDFADSKQNYHDSQDDGFLPVSNEDVPF